MRFSITYEAKKLPIGYRMTVVSLVKEALKLGNEDYFKEVYEKNKNEMKPFSFAVYLRNFKYEDTKILLDSLTVTFSSPDATFMIHLFNGLQQLHTYHAREGIWKRISIEMVKEVEHTYHAAVYRTLSPILIENKHGKPVHPHEEDYAENFRHYSNLRIKNFKGRAPYQEITVEPLGMKKQVIKENNSEFNKAKKGDFLYFTAYQGHLKLYGHPDDLQLLYQTGVGRRASQGFGLLEFEQEGGKGL